MLADKIREEKTGREGRNKAMNGTKGRGKRKDRTKGARWTEQKGGKRKDRTKGERRRKAKRGDERKDGAKEEDKRARKEQNGGGFTMEGMVKWHGKERKSKEKVAQNENICKIIWFIL